MIHFMTQNHLFFPVGTQVTYEQLKGYSEEKLARRQILDPSFASFDPNFSWKDCIDTNIKDPKIRQYIEGALEQFSTTPEGQQVLRQIAAMQAIKFTQAKTIDGKPIRKKAVIIDGKNFNTGSFAQSSGIIEVNYDDLMRSEYLGTNGKWYDFNVQNTLFHELVHLADPIAWINAQRNEHHRFKDGIFRVTLIELPAIDATNTFMRKYYYEQERALNYSAARSEFLVDYRATTQSDLGEDHYYDRITLPARTTKTQKRNEPQK